MSDRCIHSKELNATRRGKYFVFKHAYFQLVVPLIHLLFITLFDLVIVVYYQMNSIQRRRSGSECGGNIVEGNCKCEGGKLLKCTLESVG